MGFALAVRERVEGSYSAARVGTSDSAWAAEGVRSAAEGDRNVAELRGPEPRPESGLANPGFGAATATHPDATPQASTRSGATPKAASCNGVGSPADGSSPGEDAHDEDDLIDDLGDAIAILSAHLAAATYRLLELIARFDRLRGWERAGYSSCAHWLAVRTTIELGAAREKVRTARALERLPLTSAAMARGELSYSQVRALTRVAEPETEADLLELARGATTAQLERIVSVWRRARCKDEAEWERQLHESRTFSVFLGDDGLYVVKGRLMPEVGALLMRAIEAAGDAQFCEKWVPWEDSARAAAQRRADAVALLAERALAAGFGGREACGCDLEGRGLGASCDDAGFVSAGATQAVGQAEPPRSAAEGSADAGVREIGRGAAVGEADPEARVVHSVQPTTEGGGRAEHAAVERGRAPVPATGAEAGACRCPSRKAPISGTRAERYQVMVHVDAKTLAGEPEPAGLSELEDGVGVSAETSRRLACDAAVVRVLRGEDGVVLDVGRRTRTIPPALRRALEVRDRGCRFPGCGRRFTAAHHVVHWAKGGETSLSNCLLLCGLHHRLVHEGGWTVEWWGAGRPAFRDPRGSTHFDGGWTPPELPADPVAALVAENRARGVAPGRLTAAARWEREADVPLEVWSRAVEAVL